MSGANRTKAIRKTRIAQVAGLVLVALVAVAVIYDPGLPEAPSQPAVFGGSESTDTPQANNSTPADNQQDINAGIIGDSLQNVAKVEGVEQIEPITPDTQPNQQTTEVTSADGWKYLGGVFEPNFSFALVEIDGKQRMLRKGTRLEAYDAEVIDVARDKIEIDRGGVIERISLSKSSGQIVSVATPPEQGAAATINIPGQAATRNYLSDRDTQIENMTDVEKRRDEFERRMKEREMRQRGEER